MRVQRDFQFQPQLQLAAKGRIQETNTSEVKLLWEGYEEVRIKSYWIVQAGEATPHFINECNEIERRKEKKEEKKEKIKGSEL